MKHDEILKLLYLLSSVGMGRPRIWELMRIYGSFDEIYSALKRTLSSDANAVNFFTPSELKSAAAVNENQLEKLIGYCADEGIDIIGYNDERYPIRLRRIFNSPILLFCKGNTELISANAVMAVVGTRRPSEYSRGVTRRVCSKLAKDGMIVASGFAVGTDIEAHLSAVRAGGKTISVLGTGIGAEYPEQNMQYYNEILRNGVFVSEFFPNSQGNRSSFKMRNRILSGLALGTVVVEAADRSGSLNTASYAISQGKDLWVVPPHDIFDERYAGNAKLTADGAIPLLSDTDIINEYFENISHKPVKDSVLDAPFLHAKIKPGKELREAYEGKAGMPGSNDSEFEGDEKTVYDIIKKARGGISPDEVAESSGLDIADVLMIITELEISGAVRSETGQEYYA